MKDFDSPYKYFDGIDLFKYIMAYAVVIIHADAFESTTLPFFIEWIIRQAVPFFFIVSGFFLHRKAIQLDHSQKANLYLSRAINLLRIFGVWLIIYLPLSIIYFFHEHFTFAEILRNYIFTVLVYGQSFMAMPLWFIYSLSLSCFLLFICSKTNHNRLILLILGIGVYLVEWIDKTSLLSITPNQLIHTMFLYTHRTLGGLIYIVAGTMIFKLIKTSFIFQKGIFCILVSILLFYFKFPFWQLFGGCGFMLIGIDLNLSSSSIWSKLRQQSMWIYYTHMLFIFPLSQVLKKGYIEDGLNFFIICILTCGIMGYLIWRLSMVNKFSRIQQLIR